MPRFWAVSQYSRDPERSGKRIVKRRYKKGKIVGQNVSSSLKRARKNWDEKIEARQAELAAKFKAKKGLPVGG